MLIGGTLQLSLTILAVFAVAKASGYALPSSVFLGFVIAVSSTAILLRPQPGSNRGDRDLP